MLLKELVPKLAEQRIRLVDWSELDEIDRSRLARMFEDEILPVLTPQSVDRAHPFPYISNLSLNLAVVVRDPATGENRFARVKVPRLLAALLRAARRRALPADRAADRRAPRGALPRHGDRLAAPVPAHARRRARGRRGRRAPTCSPRSSPGLHRRLRLNDAVRLEIDKTMSANVRDLLDVGARAHARRRVRDRGAARPRRAVGAVRTRAPGSEGRAVAAADAAAAGRSRTAPPTSSRVVCRGRRAGAPPVRLVPHLGRSVPHAGRDRSRRARDQAHALPHLGPRQPDRARADPRRAGGQGGRRADRAEGALRRGLEHRVGAARSSRRACTWCTASSG